MPNKPSPLRFLKRRKRKRGFTLVEVLVVVLIIAILMAVGLPLYLSSIATAQTNACRANMQTISNAAMAWMTQTRAGSYSSMTLSALNVDLGATPICPSGGTYSIVLTGTVNNSSGVATSIPSGSFGINCSYAGHNGFIPGVMTQ